MENNSFGNGFMGVGAAPTPTPAPEPTPTPTPTLEPTPVLPITSEATGPAPIQPTAPELTATPGTIMSPTPNATQDVPTTVGDAKGGDQNYEGVYGWLIVYAVSAILFVINNFSSFMSPLDTDGCEAFDAVKIGLCTSFSNYVPLHNIIMAVLLALNLASFVLIISRKRIAKNVAIATAIAEPVLLGILVFYLKSIVDAMAVALGPFAGLLLSGINNSMARLYASLAISAILGVAWTLYFLKSERVKRTLVK